MAQINTDIFRKHLDLSASRGAYFASTEDSDLLSILNISAEVVADMTGRSDFNGANLIELNNPILNYAVLVHATYSLETSNPTVSEQVQVEGVLTSNREAISDFKESAVYQKLQNLISLSGLRDVTNWVDV